MGINLILTKITTSFKRPPPAPRGATEHLMSYKLINESSPHIFHGAKELTLPQQILLIQSIQVHITSEERVSCAGFNQEAPLLTQLSCFTPPFPSVTTYNKGNNTVGFLRLG